MTRYEELERKADSLREAALRCYKRGNIAMGRVWESKMLKLRAQARTLPIEEGAEDVGGLLWRLIGPKDPSKYFNHGRVPKWARRTK